MAARNCGRRLKIVAVIAGVVVGGRLLLRPIFRIVAGLQIPEVFTATALLVVLGTAWLMQLAGMQMSLGAFLAGMLLADSEYRHEIDSQIEPFKGLLLGLFFVSVGVSLDLQLIKQQPVEIAVIVVAMIVLKALRARLDRQDVAQARFRRDGAAGVILAGGGEFAYVVLNLAAAGWSARRVAARSVHGRGHIVDGADADRGDRVDALAGRREIQAGSRVRRDRRHRAARDHRRLRTHGTDRGAHPACAEYLVHGAGKFGRTGGFFAPVRHSIYFGDPSRPELLRAAGVDKAEVFVLATDDPETNIRTARIVRRTYPHLKIVARARNRQHAFRLMDMNIEHVVRETLYSSLEMSRLVLEDLGLDPAVAQDRVDKFEKHDAKVLQQQYLVYDDEAALVQSAKDALDDLQKLFEADVEQGARRAITDER